MIQDDQIIVYQPFCKQIVEHLTKDDTMQMIDIVKEIHSIGVIHRDINPNHFMRCPTTNKIVLIDFGCAYIMKDDQVDSEINTSNLHDENLHDENTVCFQGSIEFGPQEILDHLCNQNR